MVVQFPRFDTGVTIVFADDRADIFCQGKVRSIEIIVSEQYRHDCEPVRCGKTQLLFQIVENAVESVTQSRYDSFRLTAL